MTAMLIGTLTLRDVAAISQKSLQLTKMAKIEVGESRSGDFDFDRRSSKADQNQEAEDTKREIV